MSKLMISNGEHVWVGALHGTSQTSANESEFGWAKAKGTAIHREASNDPTIGEAPFDTGAVAGPMNGYSATQLAITGASGIAVGALAFAALQAVSANPDLLSNASGLHHLVSGLSDSVAHFARSASEAGSDMLFSTRVALAKGNDAMVQGASQLVLYGKLAYDAGAELANKTTEIVMVHGGSQVASAGKVVAKHLLDNALPVVKAGALAGGAVYGKKVGSELMKALKGEQTGSKTVYELRKYHRELATLVKGCAKSIGQVLGLVEERKVKRKAQP